MKHILFTKELLLLVVALFAIIATSCIKEDLDQCYTLKLKVENIKGDDITEYGWMESTDLYIFDENLNYLEKRRLDKNFIRSRNEIVLDGYTADRSLRIVAWGNVNALGEKQSVSEAQTIEDLKVMLKSQDGLAVTPDKNMFANNFMFVSYFLIIYDEVPFNASEYLLPLLPKDERLPGRIRFRPHPIQGSDGYSLPRSYK